MTVPLALGCTLLVGFFTPDVEAAEGPCDPAHDAPLLSQASELVALRDKIAFLGNSSAGPMDGLFLFTVSTSPEDHILLRATRLDAVQPLFPPSLAKVRTMARLLAMGGSVRQADLEKLDLGQKLLLLSLLGHEKAVRREELRTKLGFNGAGGDDLEDFPIFRDPATGLTFAQRDQAILQFGEMEPARATGLLRRIEQSQSARGPLSIWNPRTDTWLDARLSGRRVPSPAALQVDIGPEGGTVLGSVADTYSFHTRFSDGGILDGSLLSPAAVRNAAKEIEREDKIRKKGSVLLGSAEPTLEERSTVRSQGGPGKLTGSSEPPEQARRVLSAEEVQEAFRKHFLAPRLKTLEDTASSYFNDRFRFSKDFVERTHAEAALAQQTVDQKHPSAPQVSDSVKIRGSGLTYLREIQEDNLSRTFETTGRPVFSRSSAALSGCMTDSYGKDGDRFKYCLERSPGLANPTHAVRFESRTRNGDKDSLLEVAVQVEVRVGEDQGSAVRINASKRTDGQDFGLPPATYFTRLKLDQRRDAVVRGGEVGTRYCDQGEACMEVVYRQRSGPLNSPGDLPTPEGTSRSFNLVFTRPF